MANYMLVRQEVKDYSVWKRGYDAHRPKRVEAGLAEKSILQGTDDPHEIVVLFEADDLDRAREFAKSADLRQTMTKAGVSGQPDITYLHD
jgi:hypothetical protein